MNDRYYISDHHFGHANILKFEKEGRPFETIQAMNDFYIAQHNSRVKKGDTVVFGGDFVWSKFGEEFLKKTVGALNGRKELILGNHDKFAVNIYQRYFAKVGVVQNINFNGDRYLLSHYPVQVDELSYLKGNIHGHTHSRLIKDDRYYNISVEHSNGLPRTIHEIINRVAIK